MATTEYHLQEMNDVRGDGKQRAYDKMKVYVRG